MQQTRSCYLAKKAYKQGLQSVYRLLHCERRYSSLEDASLLPGYLLQCVYASQVLKWHLCFALYTGHHALEVHAQLFPVHAVCNMAEDQTVSSFWAKVLGMEQRC